MKDYRRSPEVFTLEYQRETPARLSGEVEEAIAGKLLREKSLVDDPKLPIGSYNYSAIHDHLQKKAIPCLLIQSSREPNNRMKAGEFVSLPGLADTQKPFTPGYSPGLLVQLPPAVSWIIDCNILVYVGAAVLVDVSVAVLVDVSVAVLVDVSVAVLVDVGVAVSVGVIVAPLVGVNVDGGVCEAVLVGVNVDVGVCVDVPVSVNVTVRVSVAVGTLASLIFTPGVVEITSGLWVDVGRKVASTTTGWVAVGTVTLGIPASVVCLPGTEVGLSTSSTAADAGKVIVLDDIWVD